MSDDTAARDRMRRVRAHRKGDHSQGCTAGNCDALKAELNAPLEPPPGKEPGEPPSAAQAVLVVLVPLNFEATDPRNAMGVIALRLATAIDRGHAGAAAMARQICTILSHITTLPGDPPSELDEIRLERETRRAQM